MVRHRRQWVHWQRRAEITMPFRLRKELPLPPQKSDVVVLWIEASKEIGKFAKVRQLPNESKNQRLNAYAPHE
jgi:hypothetical protein